MPVKEKKEPIFLAREYTRRALHVGSDYLCHLNTRRVLNTAQVFAHILQDGMKVFLCVGVLHSHHGVGVQGKVWPKVLEILCHRRKRRDRTLR